MRHGHLDWEVAVEDRDVYNSDASWLAHMIDLDDRNRELWKKEEYEAILKVQLSAPLDFDLSYLGEQTGERVRTLCSGQQPPIRSFHDLLHHPCPPVELLELTKEFARACRSRPDPLLPDDVAPLLYILSIVVAMTKCRCRITKLDDQALQHSLDWALSQSWVDEATRELLRAGSQAIADEELDLDE
jgi:hypothetical protein